jgi:tyrosyl-tRNA synthetase
MSKSLGNAIGITDRAEDMYGKVMSLPDSLMCDYFDVLSSGEWGAHREVFDAYRAGEGEPMPLKHTLASLIVARIHGEAAAARGEEHFRRVVQRKEVPDEVPEATLELGGEPSISLLVALDQLDLVGSRGEGRRLVKQGAVSIDGEKVEDALQALGPGQFLLRVGKRRYLNLTLVG